jgi:hypothetical protein
MAARETLEAGNSSIDAESEFADGYCNGNLYYYDTNHQFPHPLKSEAISRLILDNLHDARKSVQWNAGFVCGWLVAMCENHPDYFFTSLPIAPPVPVAEYSV